ncbi:MAG: YibE/F family protein [Acidimicrobiales bacterium]
MTDADHGHSHELPGGWSVWLGRTGLRVILGLLAVAAAVTAIAVVALWPDGSGRDEAAEAATAVGLASDRVSGTIQSVTDAQCSYASPELPQDCRTVVVVPDGGTRAGEPITLPEFNLDVEVYTPDFTVGEQIVLGFEPTTEAYFYADRDRRSSLLWLAAVFAVVVIALGRFRGVLALVSMSFTLVVLVGWLAPTVLDGTDPLLASVVAASLIAFVGLYLTHGLTPTTTVAVAGTLGALLVTLAVSAFFFDALEFTGLATEEGLALPIIAGGLDLPRLLLGGALLGALGALDDVTITQVATVGEVARRNPELSRGQLIASGIRVGREHIASTVNTLLLAYVGASMPLLLLFAVSSQSLDLLANAELIAVEIARTLCGSIGLVAAVPVTTALAAAVVVERGPEPEEAHDDHEVEAVHDAHQVVAVHDVPEPVEPEPEAQPDPPASWDSFAPDSDDLEF